MLAAEDRNVRCVFGAKLHPSENATEGYTKERYLRI